jgi:hypothetical protein
LVISIPLEVVRENKDDGGRWVKLAKALTSEFPMEKQYLRSIPFRVIRTLSQSLCR